MKTFVRLCLAAVALPAAALAAVGAAAPPLLVPSTDATVTYRLDGAAVRQIPGGAPNGVRLSWDAAGQRLRAEAVGTPTYAITDLRRRREDIVFANQMSVLELPLRDGDPQALVAGSDARFTRRGTARVLRLDCTEWAVQSRHMDVVGCVTADGLILRANGTWNGEPGSALAMSVDRGPVPPAAFAIPANFFVLPLGGVR